MLFWGGEGSFRWFVHLAGNPGYSELSQSCLNTAGNILTLKLISTHLQEYELVAACVV